MDPFFLGVDQESQELIKTGYSPYFSNLCGSFSDNISVKSSFHTKPVDFLANTTYSDKNDKNWYMKFPVTMAIAQFLIYVYIPPQINPHLL